MLLAAFVLLAGAPCSETYAQTKKSRGKNKAKTEQVSSKKKSGNNKKKPVNKKKAARPEPRTKEEMRRMQNDAQKEIARTREEIRRNDAEVKKSLNELGKLQGDIAAGEKTVAESKVKVASLQSHIDTLQVRIAAEEKSIASLRAEYLKALNKIRANRKTNSDLAFIFSSKDFNQAMRRMRYLRQFSEWRKRKSAEIEARVGEMRKQNERLSAMVSAQRNELVVQVRAQDELKGNYAKQDQVVKELRRNGESLKRHLAQKQAEANSLKSRIAALIAEEQRKAEAERRAREAEAVRKAEEARKAEMAKADVAVDKPAKEEKADKKEKKVEKKDNKKRNEEYAQARRRRPRGDAKKETSTAGKTASAKGNASGAGFEGMRGSLPRPVAGEFKVTSRFGRHSLPDLPDVMYDNPGIDAETAAGASALAVFKGKVSGVYVIPGYSTVVIVNHGTYYTVYGNIASPFVKVGDMVNQGQALGKLAAEEEDSSHSSIHFEVWRNREKMNPLDWIR